MTDEKRSEFKEKIQRDLKTAKAMLLKEELISVLLAIGFALNVACIAVFPMSFVTVFNVIAIFLVCRRFRGTVKRQIMYHETLNLLKTMKEKKVWKTEE